MDKKEAAYLLQRIDCNCNDCGFMYRHMGQLNDARFKRDEMQRDSFERLRERMKEKAAYWDEQGQAHKAGVLREEIKKMKYQYESPAAEIHYGLCEKFDKPVTFIPNTCQLETQKCFIHRKDYTP
jgi:hypothetical protein